MSSLINWVIILCAGLYFWLIALMWATQPYG
jgi:hypothetical protein